MLPYLQYINVIAYFSVKYSLTKFSNIAGILLKFMTFTCTCHEKRIISYYNRYNASAITNIQLKFNLQFTFSVPGRLSSTCLDLDLDLFFALVLAFPAHETTTG